MTPRRTLDYVPPSMRGLYAIVDVGTLAKRSLDPVAFVDAVLVGRPGALQLRSKGASPRDTLALLRELAPMCHRAGVPLVANDRPDWAVIAGCDMVHVGQTDMPIDRVRRIAPTLGVGVSTHGLEQLDAALSMRPTYVAFGPVYETVTKSDPDPVVGVSALREAYVRAKAAGVPLVAIGGITFDRARELVGSSDMIAVVGDLLPPVVELEAARAQSDILGAVSARAAALSALFRGPPG